MAAHSFLESADPDSERLTMVVGVTFLKNSFSHFANMKHAFLIADSIKHPALLEKTKGLLDETAELCRSSSEMNDLLIRGNLYKICAYLIECAAADAAENDADFKERTRIVNIDKALEMIYFDYASPLTLEDASRATGYGKSNFCKIFKEITGHTFHYLLNRQRVQGACDLLCQTELSIQQIAQQVGFGETKTFCRIFKEATALTPREYRKKHGYTVK
jgi:YesN/AraC family two-component response regulator